MEINSGSQLLVMTWHQLYIGCLISSLETNYITTVAYVMQLGTKKKIHKH